MATSTELNTWTSNLLSKVSPEITKALSYWNLRYVTSTTRTVTDGKDKQSKSNPKTKTVTAPFTFDQTYANKLLTTACDAVGSARTTLSGLLSSSNVNPATASSITSKFDATVKPLFDFQKDTGGAVPNPLALNKQIINWIQMNITGKFLKSLDI
jgi:hypothetical protein